MRGREGLLRNRSLSLVNEAKLIGLHRPGRLSPISPHCIGHPDGISARVAPCISAAIQPLHSHPSRKALPYRRASPYRRALKRIDISELRRQFGSSEVSLRSLFTEKVRCLVVMSSRQTRKFARRANMCALTLRLLKRRAGGGYTPICTCGHITRYHHFRRSASALLASFTIIRLLTSFSVGVGAFFHRIRVTVHAIDEGHIAFGLRVRR